MIKRATPFLSNIHTPDIIVLIKNYNGRKLTRTHTHFLSFFSHIETRSCGRERERDVGDDGAVIYCSTSSSVVWNYGWTHGHMHNTRRKYIGVKQEEEYSM